MKLKTNTMILAIAAFAIAGGATYWEISKTNRPSEEQQATEQNKLFTFNEKDVVSLEVNPDQETTLTFERTDKKFPETWEMKTPEAKIADEAAITFLLDQLVTSQSQNTVNVHQDEWPDFGIDANNPRVQVTLANGTTHRLLLGGATFDQKNLYAVVDQSSPLPESVTVSIVSTTLLDAVQRPLGEWEYDPGDLPSVSVPTVPTPSSNSSKPQ